MTGGAAYVPYLEFGGGPLDRSNEIRVSGSIEVRVKPEMWRRWFLMMFPPSNITAQTMPGHDPPVAWRGNDFLTSLTGVSIICCPALLFGGCAIGQLPDGIPILDSEPGRR